MEEVGPDNEIGLDDVNGGNVVDIDSKTMKNPSLSFPVSVYSDTCARLQHYFVGWPV